MNFHGMFKLQIELWHKNIQTQYLLDLIILGLFPHAGILPDPVYVQETAGHRVHLQILTEQPRLGENVLRRRSFRGACNTSEYGHSSTSQFKMNLHWSFKKDSIG